MPPRSRYPCGIVRPEAVHLDGLSNEKVDAVLEGMNRIEPGIAFYVDASGQVAPPTWWGSIENPGESFKIARHKGVYRGDVSADGLMSILAAENAGPGLVGTNLFPADRFKKLIGGARSAGPATPTQPRKWCANSSSGPELFPPLPDRTGEGSRRAPAGPECAQVGWPDGFRARARCSRTQGSLRLGDSRPRRLEGVRRAARVSRLRPLRGKIWGTALLIAAFVLAAIALSILLARRLVRPIKRLQVAAEAIGAGAYDERIELSRKDELGALARPSTRWPSICRT